MANEPIDLKDLVPGYAFPPAPITIDAARAAAYLRATEGDGSLFEAAGSVPPMAVAALAMAAMGEAMALPAGTVHVSQEVTFHRPARIGEVLISRAMVTRRVARGKINLMNVGMNVADPSDLPVMTGETSFVLPT
jgi:acyl dehydratase